jgi:hypothetical protein
MAKALKTRASKQEYISPAQPTLPGFETPYRIISTAKSGLIQIVQTFAAPIPKTYFRFHKLLILMRTYLLILNGDTKLTAKAPLKCEAS